GTLVLAGGSNVQVGTDAATILTGLVIGGNIGGTAGAGTLNILPSANLTDAGAFYVGTSVQGTVNQSGGNVNLTASRGVNTANGLGNNTALRIAQGNTQSVTSTYNLTGGNLTAAASEMTVGDGNGVFNISGGANTFVNLRGIRESNLVNS